MSQETRQRAGRRGLFPVETHCWVYSGGRAMYVLIVPIHIKPEHREAFLESMLDDAIGSVRDEPGCLRFDVIQDSSDPNCIYLYEVYRDEAAFQSHTEAPHFVRWRETVQRLVRRAARRDVRHQYLPPGRRLGAPVPACRIVSRRRPSPAAACAGCGAPRPRRAAVEHRTGQDRSRVAPFRRPLLRLLAVPWPHPSRRC